MRILIATLAALSLALPALAQEEAPPTTPPDAGKADPPLPAEEVAPEPAAEPALPEVPIAPLPDVEAKALCPEARPCLEGGDFAMWPRFRMRTGWEFVQADPSVAFVGQNDGFLLDQARLGVEGTYLGRMDFRLVLDLVSALPAADNDPVVPVFGATRDAWLRFNANDYFGVTVGQIFLPVDREGQTPRDEMIFSYRSVAVDGLRRGRGFAVRGLSAGREVGVMIGKQDAEMGDIVLDYRLAASNGNGDNHLGNDNKLPAVTGRFAAGYKELASLGVSGRWNPRTVGELPNLFNETDLQGSVDFTLKSFGIELLAQAIFRQTSFDTVFFEGDPDRNDTAVGLTSWLVFDEPFGVPMFGFRPGVRFSYYDPKGAFPDDQIMEITAGLRYDPPTELPMMFMLDFTALIEPSLSGGDSTRSLDNNRVVALLQFDL
jgi:hypothetical protein